MTKIKFLPKPLRHLVFHCVGLLGDVIRDHCGDAGYEQVEALRRAMVEYRDSDNPKAILQETFQQLALTPLQERQHIAHSFTLMMELINACENAYRTYRLQQSHADDFEQCASDNTIIFVLTAHPTESRFLAKTSVYFIKFNNAASNY